MPRRRPTQLPLVLFTALLASIATLGTACSEDDPKLKVTDITPDKGDAAGNTYVIIRGNRFLKDGPRNAKVYFGTRQGQVVRFASDTELVVQSPPGKDGDVVDVQVIFDPGGQLVIKKAFRFVEKGSDVPSVDDLDTSKKK